MALAETGQGQRTDRWVRVHRLVPGQTESIRRHNSSFLAVSYWSLLADIVSVPAAEVETLKSWLLPLLRRVHLSSIVVSYLQCVPNIDVNTLPELNAQIRRCLAVLWPLALRKLSAENLLDSLGALMKVLSSHELGEDICQVGQWITTAFLSSIDNSVSKKKVSA